MEIATHPITYETQKNSQQIRHFNWAKLSTDHSTFIARMLHSYIPRSTVFHLTGILQSESIILKKQNWSSF